MSEPTAPPLLHLRVTFEIPTLVRNPETHNLESATRTVTGTGHGYSQRVAISSAKRAAGVNAVLHVKVIKIEELP